MPVTFSPMSTATPVRKPTRPRTAPTSTGRTVQLLTSSGHELETTVVSIRSNSDRLKTQRLTRRSTASPPAIAWVSGFPQNPVPVVSIRSATDRLETQRLDAQVDCSYRRFLGCLDSGDFLGVWIHGCLDSWVSGFTPIGRDPRCTDAESYHFTTSSVGTTLR